VAMPALQPPRSLKRGVCKYEIPRLYARALGSGLGQYMYKYGDSLSLRDILGYESLVVQLCFHDKPHVAPHLAIKLQNLKLSSCDKLE
jgi:hypothetical protein